MSEYQLRIGETEYTAEVKELTPDQARIVINGTEYKVDLINIARPAVAETEIVRPQPSAASTIPAKATSSRPNPASRGGAVRSPLPGMILEVKVKEGAAVNAGDPLLIMEAMKMENVVPAPHNGTVKKILVSNGDNVAEGDVLIEVSRPEMTTL